MQVKTGQLEGCYWVQCFPNVEFKQYNERKWKRKLPWASPSYTWNATYMDYMAFALPWKTFLFAMEFPTTIITF